MMSHLAAAHYVTTCFATVLEVDSSFVLDKSVCQMIFAAWQSVRLWIALPKR
jgi:hypothetical protein